MGVGQRRLLSIVSRDRLARILKTMLDEDEFLSPYGLRALSRYHKEHPFVLRLDGHEYRVDYEPAESTSGLFGGNSNWRGPVWFPLNYLLIEALQKFHYYYGGTLKVESPTGSGNMCDLWEVSAMLSNRLINLFLPDENGHRPVFGGVEKFNTELTGATTSCSTNTSTATTGPGSGPAIRPAGRRWLQSSSNSAANTVNDGPLPAHPLTRRDPFLRGPGSLFDGGRPRRARERTGDRARRSEHQDRPDLRRRSQSQTRRIAREHADVAPLVPVDLGPSSAGRLRRRVGQDGRLSQFGSILSPR